MTEIDQQSRSLHLLSLAKTIRHYETALRTARGEHFNLFEILHVGHYEVRTHSPVLAELLDPRGSHGQGAVFLRLFLRKIGLEKVDAETARVETEVSIGKYGRIDIEVTVHGHRILIENKIYAELQDNQLLRYHDHDPSATLVYLTLKGDEPKDWSTNDGYKSASFRHAFKRFSYHADVVDWLESCRKESAASPGVREGITQYVHLIRRLTNQNTSTLMNLEVVKAVIHDSKSYLAYATLRKADEAIRAAVFAKANDRLDSIAHRLGAEPVEKLTHSDTEVGYMLTTSALRKMNLKFGFQSDKDSKHRIFYGFTYIDSSQIGGSGEQIEKGFCLVIGPSGKPTERWPAWQWWKQHEYFDDETLAAVLSEDDEFAANAEKLLSSLNKVAALLGESVKR